MTKRQPDFLRRRSRTFTSKAAITHSIRWIKRNGGPSNPPALVPNHASQMYAKNITTFLAHLLGKDGAKKTSLELDLTDEITRETLLTRNGEVVHARVKELLVAPARA